MNDKAISDAAKAAIAAEEFLTELAEFVEKNIVKVEVKVTEGPMLKEARKIVAEGLVKIAQLIEDPSQEIKWVDIKKKR